MQSIGLNNSGEIVFEAFLDDGGHGIFTGPDVLSDRVIKSGDPLYDSTVSLEPRSVRFFREGVNDSGQVAFWARLENGVEGIFLATPLSAGHASAVPEPSALALLVIVGAILLAIGKFAAHGATA